ncbi:hypothetical protein BKA60DRAFT_643045 [Fusarium oxysporum]|nr:hypothetical protein BKA60DRAFT_643045 [Fusarium oxysporum]
MHQFANDLAEILATSITEYDIDQHWASTGPKAISLVKEPFFRDYAAAHGGRLPYIDPSPSVRWSWGESQPDSILDDAIKSKTLFMDWFNRNVLPRDKDHHKCSSAILLHTDSTGSFGRRNIYRDPPRVPFGWSLSKMSIFSEAPDSVYPLGEVPYVSDITNYEESLPVTVDIMVARGCDGLISRLAQDLVESGILKVPKAGGNLTGASILF